ncbi:MAG: hypothetical protein HKM93_18020 [Desulfobacteraceae bacterium]|nr:hypothetical protein [Desulfobacteraceae bacterium]
MKGYVFGATIITAICLLVILIGPPASGTNEEKPQDDALPLLRLVDAEGWIQVDYADHSQSSQVFTRICTVEVHFSAITAFLITKQKKIVPYFTDSEENDFILGEVEEKCRILNTSVPMMEQRCTSTQKRYLRARITGGKVNRLKKPIRLDVINLEIQNFEDARDVHCVTCVSSKCTESNQQSGGTPADSWWPTALYNWPLKDGHTETIGHYKYTLVLNRHKR